MSLNYMYTHWYRCTLYVRRHMFHLLVDNSGIHILLLPRGYPIYRFCEHLGGVVSLKYLHIDCNPPH